MPGPGGESLWRLDDETWLVRYRHPHRRDGWTMRVGEAGRRIAVAWTDGLGIDDIVTVVEAAGLSCALHLMGVPLLHGCAIEVDGRAIVLAGPPGAGKSTAAAAFVGAGHALLSDDISALDIEERVTWVHPASRRPRLLPDAARAVGRAAQTIEPVFRDPLLTGKRFLDLSREPGAVCAEPRPLAAVYVLAPRGPSQAVAVMPFRPAEVPAVLLAHTYARRWLDRPRLARLFTAWAAVAGSVRVCRVQRPDDLTALPEVVEAVAADARGGTAVRAAVGRT